MFILALTCEHQKNCGDFPKTTVFKSYAMKHSQKSQYASTLPYALSVFFCFSHSAAPGETMPTNIAIPCCSEN